MALIQVGAIFAGIRLARRVDQLATQLDQDIKPLIANLTALSSEAARAAALAAKQAERLDRVFGEMVQRVDQTLAAAQEFVTGPARQGMAIMAGVKAVFDAFRGMREASRRRTASAPGRRRGRIAFHRLIRLRAIGYGATSVLNGGMKFLTSHTSGSCPSAFAHCLDCRRRRAGTQVRRAREGARAAAGHARSSIASPRACPTAAKSSSARWRSRAS